MLQLLGITSRPPMHRICLLILLCLSLSLTTAFGQSTYGAIIGTVKDTSGAAIPNASIKITNLDENTSRDVQSKNNGDSELLSLLPGHYSVAGTVTGFETSNTTGLLLVARQTLRVDPKLHVRQISQSV